MFRIPNFDALNTKTKCNWFQTQESHWYHFSVTSNLALHDNYTSMTHGKHEMANTYPWTIFLDFTKAVNSVKVDMTWCNSEFRWPFSPGPNTSGKCQLRKSHTPQFWQRLIFVFWGNHSYPLIFSSLWHFKSC